MPTYTFRFPASLPSLPVTVYPLTGGVRGASAATGTTGSDATFTTTLAAGDYLAVVQYRGTETGVRESLTGGLADAPVTIDALNDPASDASVILKAAYASVIEAVNTVAASGSTVTLPDVTTATVHDVTLTANCTITLPALAAGKSLTIRLTQDATGSRVPTFSPVPKWAGGTAPTWSTGVGKQDVLTLVSVGGTAWTGSALLDVR